MGFRAYQWCLLLVLLVACVVISARYLVDFQVLHGAAVRATSAPTQIYGEPFGTAGARFFYGPICLILLYPLSYFDLHTAKWIWIFFQCVSFAILWQFIRTHFSAVINKGWLFLWLFAFSINSIHNGFQSNNVQLMILAALIVAERLTWSEGRFARVASGLLVMLVALVKVYPFFIVVLYGLVKPKHVKLGLVGGAVLFISLPFLFFGKAPALVMYQQFVASLGSYHSGNNSLVESFNIQCLPSLLARFTPRSWAETGVYRVFLGGVTLAVSLPFFFYAWKRREADFTTRLNVWTMALALMAFLNPSSYGHYVVFYIPALAAAMQSSQFPGDLRSARGWALIVGPAILFLVVDSVIGKPLSNALQRVSVPTFGLILILFAAFRYQPRFQLKK